MSYKNIKEEIYIEMNKNLKANLKDTFLKEVRLFSTFLRCTKQNTVL